MGANVFCWNVMSDPSMRAIAEQVPMSMQDLKAMGTLGENIIKECCARVVKLVAMCVRGHGLEGHLSKNSKKRKRFRQT